MTKRERVLACLARKSLPLDVPEDHLAAVVDAVKGIRRH
jgi:hypothetical protein